MLVNAFILDLIVRVNLNKWFTLRSGLDLLKF